jgi:hypothetical protein
MMQRPQPFFVQTETPVAFLFNDIRPVFAQDADAQFRFTAKQLPKRINVNPDWTVWGRGDVFFLRWGFPGVFLCIILDALISFPPSTGAHGLFVYATAPSFVARY